MEFSIQILPTPTPFDAKKNPQFLLCLYYVYYHQIWREPGGGGVYPISITFLKKKNIYSHKNTSRKVKTLIFHYWGVRAEITAVSPTF